MSQRLGYDLHFTVNCQENQLSAYPHAVRFVCLGLLQMFELQWNTTKRIAYNLASLLGGVTKLLAAC